jgi:hypothetical protein
METKKEITDKILKLTILIQEQYPELSHELDAAQDTLPPHGEDVNAEHLARYYHTLEQMVAQYVEGKNV